MIAISLILLLLAVLGAPLFAVIATSAMVGFHSDDTDLSHRDERDGRLSQ
jgi:hypothetical protein